VIFNYVEIIINGGKYLLPWAYPATYSNTQPNSFLKVYIIVLLVVENRNQYIQMVEQFHHRRLFG
jgi:hypothetical protein